MFELFDLQGHVRGQNGGFLGCPIHLAYCQMSSTLELVDESQKYVYRVRLKHLYIETTVQKDFSQKSIFAREITFKK